MRTARTAVFVSLAIAALAARGAPAQSPPVKAAPKQVQAPARTQKQPLQTDAVIEAAIRAKFAKAKINDDKFQVHVQGGVATLEGRTSVIQHKGVATRMAKTGGAVAVNNRIQVDDAARAKAAANLDQGRRRVQVKRGDDRSQAAPGTATKR
jgi:hypothetical protein